MQVIILHDVDGPKTAGIETLCEALRSVGLEAVCPEVECGWWPRSTFRDWKANNAPDALAVVGIGSGGQAAFRSAYDAGRGIPVVAAIAPACDLGRWYGRGTEIDAIYKSPDAARQDEAPLYFNPLSRPLHQLCWCDPRDEACMPSALRIVSKSESSGVPVESDMTTQCGTSRDSYVEKRALDLAQWIRDACDRVASSVELPIVSSR